MGEAAPNPRRVLMLPYSAVHARRWSRPHDHDPVALREGLPGFAVRLPVVRRPATDGLTIATGRCGTESPWPQDARLGGRVQSDTFVGCIVSSSTPSNSVESWNSAATASAESRHEGSVAGRGPLPQVRWSCGGPLLTARNRQAPMLRARGARAGAWRWLPPVDIPPSRMRVSAGARAGPDRKAAPAAAGCGPRASARAGPGHWPRTRRRRP
jgi:hypothetical protein